MSKKILISLNSPSPLKNSNFKNLFFLKFSEQSNNSNNDCHEDNLDVVSLVGEDDLEEHHLKDEQLDQENSEDELAEKPEEEFLRRQKESREFESEKARGDRESKSPVANGFATPPTQPFFNHAFAAAFAAGGKSPFDAILPPLPSSALSPHEYLARYYQFMQQQQSQNAAVALSAAAAQAANSAKMGSPVLHRNFDSGIEQQTN